MLQKIIPVRKNRQILRDPLSNELNSLSLPIDKYRFIYDKMYRKPEFSHRPLFTHFTVVIPSHQGGPAHHLNTLFSHRGRDEYSTPLPDFVGATVSFVHPMQTSDKKLDGAVINVTNTTTPIPLLNNDNVSTNNVTSSLHANRPPSSNSTTPRILIGTSERPFRAAFKNGCKRVCSSWCAQPMLCYTL